MDQLVESRFRVEKLLIAFVLFAIIFPLHLRVSAKGLFETTPPTNPTICIEGNGASNDVWQNTISDTFYICDSGFDAESGVNGYYVYWGTDPNGVSGAFQSSVTTIDPPGISSGTYFLRLNTIDVDGNMAGWATLFTFRYDNSPPSSIAASAIDLNGSQNHIWQNVVNNPILQIQGVLEPDSGISGYYYYWGQDINGTSTEFSASSTISPASVSEGISYLRIRAVDNMGNEEGVWSTIYTFQYDITDPAPPPGPSGELNGVMSNSWQSLITTPTFNWAPSSDAASYDVYFGSDINGIGTVNVATTSYHPA